MGAAWTDRGNRVGRSEARRRVLRDLDLRTRAFTHPLSYLIYGEEFDALPPVAKNYVYRRLREVLTGADMRPEFAHLSPSDCTAILEILRDTKPDFKLI
jgi:hypothetical protein